MSSVEDRGKIARDLRLKELGLQYPFWVFTVDELPWPRKIASILPGSRATQIIGWYRWGWEYGTDLRRINDELPPGVSFTPQNNQCSEIRQILDRLRYDHIYDADEFRVVYEAGKPLDRQSRSFSEWSFDPNANDHVAARRIVRVEREWDHVPVWDRENGIDLLSQPLQIADKVFGIASEVQNDEELLFVAGVDPGDDGKSIRKACFEFVDDVGGQCRGLVYAGKTHDNHGIIRSRGADNYNKKILQGTGLENKPWVEVEEYLSKLRAGALL